MQEGTPQLFCYLLPLVLLFAFCGNDTCENMKAHTLIEDGEEVDNHLNEEIQDA